MVVQKGLPLPYLPLIFKSKYFAPHWMDQAKITCNCPLPDSFSFSIDFHVFLSIHFLKYKTYVFICCSEKKMLLNPCFPLIELKSLAGFKISFTIYWLSPLSGLCWILSFLSPISVNSYSFVRSSWNFTTSVYPSLIPGEFSASSSVVS